MKIARFVYEWPPPWIGLTPAAFEITRFQSMLGHDIEVFCGRWPKAGPVVKLEGVKIHAFPREILKGLMLLTTAPLMTLYFLLWRIFNKPDIYHVHGHFGLYLFAYKLLFGLIDRVPVVAHFHISARSRWEKMLKEGKRISLVSRYVSWPLEVFSEKLALKISDHFVFVGQEILNDVVKNYGADPLRCSLVESGVNTNLFKSVSAEEKLLKRTSLGFASEDVVIGNIGFLVERKNIHLLVESMKYLPGNFKLMLVGKSEDAYLKRLLRVAENDGSGDRLKVFSERNYTDLPSFYQALDLFVLPSSYEGFPKAVLESLACNVPVVASGFVTSGKISGLARLEDLSPKGISQAIVKTVYNPPFVDLEALEKKHSWYAKALEIDELYSKISKK
ncbi:glycosyltransferase family 4 protein [candidate division WWE3 bacterium]|nr:glycosyltransferase family 4 protein [candidate division WWE3 bacterium]